MSIARRRRARTDSLCEPVEARRLLAAVPVTVALDSNFGQGGLLVTDLRTDGDGSLSVDDQLWDAETLPDGDVVMAGFTRSMAQDGHGVLLRINPDGTPEAGFGQGGVVRFGDFETSATFTDVKPLPDGRLLVAGHVGTQGALLRFNGDGTLDTAFGPAGSSGVVRPPAVAGQTLSVVAVLPDGKVLAGGTVSDSPGTQGRAAVWRFNADGTPDTTFGAAGRVEYPPNGMGITDQVSALTVLPGGAVFAAVEPLGSAATLLRLNPDGSIARAAASGDALVQAPAGADKLLVAYLSAGTTDVRVVRLLASGEPDPAFAQATLDFGGNDRPVALLARPDGSALVAAATADRNGGDFSRFYLARLAPDGTPDAAFGTGGRAWLFDGEPWGTRLLPSPGAPAGSGGAVIAAGNSRLYRAPGDQSSSLNFVATRLVLDPPLSIEMRQESVPTEGGDAVVSASATYAAGRVARYEWARSYDGFEFIADGEGQTATVPVYDDHDSGHAYVRVTTSDGLQAVSGPIAPVAQNLPPAVESLTAPALTPYGFPAVFSGTVSDPGSDTLTVTVDFGDGQPPSQVAATPRQFSVAHTYATSGTYTATVTAADDDGGMSGARQASVRVVDITGTVFRDENDDGRRAAEEVLPFVGATVYIDSDADGLLDAGERRTVSDANGAYAFEGLDKGTYLVRADPPPGARVTSPTTGPVTIDDAQGARRDFGLTDRARITGVVFDDRDADGVRDDGESALGAATRAVYLDLNNDGWHNAAEPVATGIPGEAGVYALVNLEPGTYTVRYLPELATNAGAIIHEAAQTFPNARGDQTGHVVTVAPGEISRTNDFGSHFDNAPILGTVYLDRDRDGVQDAVGSGEVALSDRVVYLDFDNDGVLDPDEARSRAPDSRIGGGDYFLPTVRGHTYTVRTVVPDGWTQSQPAGGNGAPYVLTSGTDNLQNRDFGTHLTALPAVVGRHLFYYRSAFSGTHPVHQENDLAIAGDKVALLPGGRASFSNVSSYSRGINGIMVDLNDLTRVGNTNVLQFAVGDGTSASPNAWTPVPSGVQTEVRRGAGVNGSDRIVAVFADNAIQNKWLRVTVVPGPASGLSRPEVFYFGHLQGETGAGDGLRINALDLAAVKRAFSSQFTGPYDPNDINHDGRVNALDLAAVRQMLNRSLAPWAPPAPAVAPASSATSATSATSASSATAWLSGVGDRL